MDSLKYNGREYVIPETGKLWLRCPDCGAGYHVAMAIYMNNAERWRNACENCHQVVFPVQVDQVPYWKDCEDFWNVAQEVVPLFKQYRLSQDEALSDSALFALRIDLASQAPDLHAVAFNTGTTLPRSSEGFGLMRSMTNEEVDAACLKVMKRQRFPTLLSKNNDPDDPAKAARHVRFQLLHRMVVAQCTYLTILEIHRRAAINKDDPWIPKLQTTLTGSTERPGGLSFEHGILAAVVRMQLANAAHASSIVDHRSSG